MRLIIEIGTKVINLSFKIITKQKSNSSKTNSVKAASALKTEFIPILHKNLRHLDFIDVLEANYSKDQLNSIPTLQELKLIKLEAQKNTLMLFNNQVA